jgi:predicted nucleic acid-binding protein
MSVFVDTSALLAMLDRREQNHATAKAAFEDLISRDEDLVCTNYVLVETFALVQSRLGMEAVRVFQDDVAPLLRVEWVDAQSHASSVAALLTAGWLRLTDVTDVRLAQPGISATSDTKSAANSRGHASTCKYFWHSRAVTALGHVGSSPVRVFISVLYQLGEQGGRMSVTAPRCYVGMSGEEGAKPYNTNCGLTCAE